MESLSFHKKMKDGTGNRCNGEQVRKCCYSSKWKVWRRTAGKREACMYCESKRSGRKEKENHTVLLVKIFPKEKLMQYCMEGTVVAAGGKCWCGFRHSSQEEGWSWGGRRAEGGEQLICKYQ